MNCKLSHLQLTQSEKAIFAAGCFWGVQADFDKISGVVQTRVGYIGGRTHSPTYEAVCRGDTGHAEAVEVMFDPFVVSYDKLLEAFLNMHDCTQLNRQGVDIGSQYRSAIFFHCEAQKEKALKCIKNWNINHPSDRPCVTEVVPASTFYEAEEYHQKYFEKNSIAGCRL